MCTKEEQKTGSWRKLLARSLFINIWVIKLRKMRQAEHVACMGMHEKYRLLWDT
jgi:hypothetical protein